MVFCVFCPLVLSLLGKLNFWLPCIIHVVSQYNEINVMHFSFSLFRIKDLYMFRALLAHPQEVLHKRHLVYCVRIMSVGCGTVALQSCHSNILNAVCVAPSEDEQEMLETCIVLDSQ
jgi:hypothetical protein